jgi:hypothetical protein
VLLAGNAAVSGTVGPIELRPLVLLSLQQGLLGMITPDLRAVEVRIAGRHVRARFAYECDLTEEHGELVSEVEGLVIGDVPDDVTVDFEAVSVPLTEPVGLVRDSAYAFLRRE